MPTPSVLVFAGSIRTGSLNEKLAALAAARLSALGAAVTHVSLRDHPMPLYDGDLEAAEGPPPAAAALAGIMTRHHGVFIACPEYNASITPLLKNAIDWVSRVKLPVSPFKERVFALSSASPGPYGGLRSLLHTRHTLEIGCGALVIPETVAVGNAGQAFAADGSLAVERSAHMLDACLSRLVREAGRLVA
jgi:chromate reductase, NAD(P)H dehydrogenase (quinone)